ncbi:hypothetical protein [Gorillibacterium sp. sgz5001074]|uniref:hypothetical protein n=1 Tax=Gorillibacterium sp. sgz5001074 TaxID=3446695 RepID=UPI003F67C0E1
MSGDCGFCGKGVFQEDGKRYYCSHCDMSVWKNGMFFRGVPFISADRARRLLKGQKAVFTCVSRAYGMPYDVEVRLLPEGKLEVLGFAKKSRKKA